MGSTTLTIDEATKERLDQYRHEDHYNYSEVLESMMAVLPTNEEMEEGCAHCQEGPAADRPIDELHGIVWWFQLPEEAGGDMAVNWLCSRDCIDEMSAAIDKQIPREPDLIRVGGHEVPAVDVTDDLTFHVELDRWEVGIGLPGLFASTEHSYDYDGEPVYVKYQGEWVHSAVIDEIIHEEDHTALLLEPDLDVTMPNHPDERERKKWEEDHAAREEDVDDEE